MPNLWNSVIERLSQWIDVAFTTEVDGAIRHWGQGTPCFAIRFSGSISVTELMTSTSLALGEAYQDGRIIIEGNLYEVVDQIMSRFDNFTADRSTLKSIIKTALGKRKQKQDVCSHYDLGNDFYRLWLDPSLTYSCAYFSKPEMTLEEAQNAKLDHSLAKLHLRPKQHILDIGCGWGSLLIRAAQNYGVTGVGLTLSSEQKAEADKNIAKEGLSDLLHVEVLDYRDLAEQGVLFDRVVSIGMIEHVGRSNYPLFFHDVQKMTKPGGLFLLHSITSLAESSGDPWLKKYIFPGGELPSLRELIAHGSNEIFYTLDVESLRRHYQKTLLCWLENFTAVRPQIVEERGEHFARTWELYLASCAASFHHGHIDVHQILFSKGTTNELPITRVV